MSHNTKPTTAQPNMLNFLVGTRDRLIADLWCVFRDMSDLTPEASGWNKEDLDLWNMVTLHSSIQNKLSSESKRSD